MVSNAIVPLDPTAAVEGVKALAVVVRELREKVFVKDQDFGIIPGTGTKPVLLLPGMEKLMRALRLRPLYYLVSEVQDFDRPLFYFRYECQLVEIETGDVVSSAIGSANSLESKWRWRKAGRACPQCGAEAIIKGKAEYGGGWVCFNRKGGCGAKFRDGDASIESQVEGRVPNEDIFDQINTIDKIAQKRALASAIKGAANVSEFFTVDLEDLPPVTVSRPLPADAIEGEIVEEPVTVVKNSAKPAGAKAASGRRSQPPAEPEPPAADADGDAVDRSDWAEYWPHSMTLQKRRDGNFMYILHTTGVNLTTFTADPFREAGFDEETILGWKDHVGRIRFSEPLIVEARQAEGGAWEIRRITR